MGQPKKLTQRQRAERDLEQQVALQRVRLDLIARDIKNIKKELRKAQTVHDNAQCCRAALGIFRKLQNDESYLCTPYLERLTDAALSIAREAQAYVFEL